MSYLLLKWLHVLATIVAVGANVTYGIWMARASRNPDVLPFILRSIKLIDERVANPAYVALLITGLLMIFAAPFSLKTPWLLTALVLYVLVVLVSMFGYTPTLRQQIEILGSEGFSSPTYQTLAKRGMILGAILAVLVSVIVFLMVVKPSLWA